MHSIIYKYSLFMQFFKGKEETPSHFSWEIASHRSKEWTSFSPKGGLVVLPGMLLGPSSGGRLWLWVFTLETRQRMWAGMTEP